MDEETDFLSSHRCSMVKRYNMPTFFTPDKQVAASGGRRMGGGSPNHQSPSVEMTDELNVRQPFNETIVEETGEADESLIHNTRFS